VTYRLADERCMNATRMARVAARHPLPGWRARFRLPRPRLHPGPRLRPGMHVWRGSHAVLQERVRRGGF